MCLSGSQRNIAQVQEPKTPNESSRRTRTKGKRRVIRHSAFFGCGCDSDGIQRGNKKPRGHHLPSSGEPSLPKGFNIKPPRLLSCFGLNGLRSKQPRISTCRAKTQRPLFFFASFDPICPAALCGTFATFPNLTHKRTVTRIEKYSRNTHRVWPL